MPRKCKLKKEEEIMQPFGCFSGQTVIYPFPCVLTPMGAIISP